MKTIVLISCVSKKGTKKVEAEKLYESALFVKSLAYAKSLKHDSIYILSAKHHLLALDAEIEPYNLTLNTMNKQEKMDWGKEVIKQLKQVADVEKDKLSHSYQGSAQAYRNSFGGYEDRGASTILK